MGLDITAYRRLAPANINDDEEEDWCWCPGASMDWSESAFPGRAKGINSSTIYSYTDSYEFRAGSYSGYNKWRDWLAQLAGYGPNAEAAWKAPSGAFWELIHFADNEGVIGPEVSAKLARDFIKFQERARQQVGEDDWRYQLYCCWRKAFEMAADDGAVDFH